VKASLAESRDSENHLPALLGESPMGRETLVEQGSRLALRQRNWKYIPPGKGPARNQTGNELGNDARPMLFDLSKDPGERTNVAESNPKMVESMQQSLERIQE
jgi:arylsulfatase A-like enzyme